MLGGAGEGEHGSPGLADWPAYRHQPIEFQGEPVVVARIDQLGVPGFSVYVPPARAAGLRAALVDAGARVVAQDAIDAARIEARYPLFGIDMTEDTIPLEAGIEDRAISTTKGCYVGQEVIIRVLHRGHGRVVRKLVGLTIDGPRPERGAKLTAGGRDVGWITSAAASDGSATVALGYLHRDFLASGHRVDRQAHRPPDYARDKSAMRSASAGGNSNAPSSARVTHCICCPSCGLGRPSSRHL